MKAKSDHKKPNRRTDSEKGRLSDLAIFPYGTSGLSIEIEAVDRVDAYLLLALKPLCNNAAFCVRLLVRGTNHTGHSGWFIGR
jgi:hypothetical protein